MNEAKIAFPPLKSEEQEMIQVSSVPHSLGITRTSVIFMIFMNVITMGLYRGYWLLSRRKSLNLLQS